MLIPEELLLIFVYLSGRLFFYDINNIIGSAKRKGFVKRILWGLLFLFITKNLFTSIVLYALYMVTILFDTFVLSAKKRDKSIFYLFHLVFGLVLIPAFASIINPGSFQIFNPFYFIISYIVENLTAFSLSVDKSVFYFAAFTGFLFTIKEGTIIIRLILANMSATPKIKDEPKHQDKKEYDRGKLIGILERSLIYFLIIVNQVGAIAIIIALKSLARFKELDDKNFAEYFLIGSLLSICVAVLPAALIKLLY